MVPMAEQIAARLKGEGISAAVINARFTKPLDTETLEFLRAMWMSYSLWKITC